MSVRLLEHVIRRAGLAVRLTDLATGVPVHDGITVTAWPSARPEHAVLTRSVSAAGVAGFARLPGLRPYEDGSTQRDDWFASPVIFPPRPFVVRVEDSTGGHLPVIREVLVPAPTPVDLALPRHPSAITPAASLAVVAHLVSQAGEPASWALVELSLGSFVTGGVTDARGAVVVPVPRSVPPTSVGSAASGPVWRVGVRVRFRPTAQASAPGSTPSDPPTISSLLTQPHALIDDGGSLVGSLERDLTSAGPLVLSSRPPPAPSVLLVRPTP